MENKIKATFTKKRLTDFVNAMKITKVKGIFHIEPVSFVKDDGVYLLGRESKSICHATNNKTHTGGDDFVETLDSTFIYDLILTIIRKKLASSISITVTKEHLKIEDFSVYA